MSTLQRLRKAMLKDDEDLCSFEVFGSDESGHAENEMTTASTSNTYFQSKSTLVVDRAGLRVMVFREEGSHGANARCQEEAEVECLDLPAANASLLQEDSDAPCTGKNACNPDPKPRLSIMRSLIGGAVTALQGKVNRVAMIGLGGGSIPLWFAKKAPEATVDAVDINADVIAGVPCMGVHAGPKMNLIDNDGRAYLSSQPDGTYDAMFLDAYTSENLVPNCLRTVEFFHMTHQKMAPGGVFLMNVWRGEVDQVFTALAKAFPSGVQLGTAPGLGNLVLLAHADGAHSDQTKPISADDLTEAQGWNKETSFSPVLPANSTYEDLIGATMALAQVRETTRRFRFGDDPDNEVPKWMRMKLSPSGTPKKGMTDAEICPQ
eukprot:gnl/MRDRNA2_/MRDRNA2_94023_c0_seq1.p1 gnl/MRDRNA2_/MRDRNA2_94023_c0~~gnl/MRDRNA2_/MRDRNA2_94023_c0_seq1.p1  ORF type:complete len:416 (+),score=98.82 gnl/MRDRNA2_/MRDRNA2_94023_c0_seq1:120-1250(+)